VFSFDQQKLTKTGAPVDDRFGEEGPQPLEAEISTSTEDEGTETPPIPTPPTNVEVQTATTPPTDPVLEHVDAPPPDPEMVEEAAPPTEGDTGEVFVPDEATGSIPDEGGEEPEPPPPDPEPEPHGPAPVIQSLSPSEAVIGGGDFQITVHGQNFVDGAIVVLFDVNEYSVNYVDSTRLSADIVMANHTVAKTVEVRVENPDNQTSNAATFTLKDQ
jgi:hypothetical protein